MRNDAESNRTNASSQRINVFNLWCLNHMRAFVFSVGDLLRHPIAYLFTVLVIGIAMALPAGLYVLIDNAKGLVHEWKGTPTISLYLKRDASNSQIQRLVQVINKNHVVKQVNYISPAAGLKAFESATSFGNVLNTLQENPIPPTLIITPQTHHVTPDAIIKMFNQLQQLPIVDTAKLDQAWVKRLFFLASMAQRITLALATLFGVALLLIVSNAIRLAMQNQRQEITVLKLVGASDGFIRRPLLYRGICFGLLGGLIACATIGGVTLWLQGPAAALANTYQKNGWVLHGLTFQAGLAVVGFCTLLSWIGAWFAVEKCLREI